MDSLVKLYPTGTSRMIDGLSGPGFKESTMQMTRVAARRLGSTERRDELS